MTTCQMKEQGGCTQLIRCGNLGPSVLLGFGVNTCELETAGTKLELEQDINLNNIQNQISSCLENVSHYKKDFQIIFACRIHAGLIWAHA